MESNITGGIEGPAAAAKKEEAIRKSQNRKKSRQYYSNRDPAEDNSHLPCTCKISQVNKLITVFALKLSSGDHL